MLPPGSASTMLGREVFDALACRDLDLEELLEEATLASN